jgi:hypothetical protein
MMPQVATDDAGDLIGIDPRVFCHRALPVFYLGRFLGIGLKVSNILAGCSLTNQNLAAFPNQEKRSKRGFLREPNGSKS